MVFIEYILYTLTAVPHSASGSVQYNTYRDQHWAVAIDSPRRQAAALSLSIVALRDLTVLAKLKLEGGILDRHFELLKKHVINGCSLTGDSLEGFGLSLEPGRIGGISEEDHAKDINGKVTDILCHSSSVEGAGASTTPSGLSAFSSKGKAPATRSASAAGSKTVNRSIGARKLSASNAMGGNILNCFFQGTGKPMRCVPVRGQFILSAFVIIIFPS